MILPKHIELQQVQNWLEQVVIGLNLCPFAKRELLNQRVRFVLSQACDEHRLLASLQEELNYMHSHPGMETSLLVHPQVLQDFAEYNQFLDLADSLLDSLQLTGVFQIASFHPDYQFADTEPDDVENYTNRSPYPLLHILREESLTKAIASHADVSAIPSNNIRHMRQLGADHLAQIFTKLIR